MNIITPLDAKKSHFSAQKGRTKANQLTSGAARAKSAQLTLEPNLTNQMDFKRLQT